ncbi:MAG: ABC transporter permease [Oscillospiraceae bacterium]|nr:ABC transporter permease [Oscillospiraceae bacterium]MBQ5337907.1 ABC transporter permease [Oscillospiraceae bacterium]
MIRYVRTAIRSMAQNPHRSFLTVLGICISVCSIVIFYTLGESINASIRQSFGSHEGHNMIFVEVVQNSNRKARSVQAIPADMAFTEPILSGFEKKWNGSVTLFQESPACTGKSYTNAAEKSVCSMLGLGTDGRFVYEMELTEGRFITAEDLQQQQPVAVISSLTAELCFGRNDPLGQYIWFEDEQNVPHQFTVVGVYRYSGDTYPTPEQNRLLTNPTVYIPYTCWQAHFPDIPNNTDTVRFNTTGISDVNMLRNVAQTYFSSLMQHDGWHIEVMLMSDELQSIQKYVDLLRKFITVIAIVSFLIGGIGIMNVMLISAQERIREIGIKKALGAKNGTIMTEFFTEAVIMAVGGAVIGALLGILICYDLANLITVISRHIQTLELTPVLFIPVRAILAACGGSLLLGMLCGVLPAMRAARMNPADALRSDAR